MLVTLVLSAPFLFEPVRTAPLHYHGWRYRSGRDTDGDSLSYVTRWAARKKAHGRLVARLLGNPWDGQTVPEVQLAYPCKAKPGFNSCQILTLDDEGRVVGVQEVESPPWPADWRSSKPGLPAVPAEPAPGGR